MKSTIVLSMLVLLSFSVFADDTQVKGYYRKDGTYVKGYTRKGGKHKQVPENKAEKQPEEKSSRTISGNVKRVVDGDTIHIQDKHGTIVKVRLYGIDAAETAKGNKQGQPYGDKAAKALESKVKNQEVTIDVMAVDKYQRTVAVVKVGNRNINEEMVAEGHAMAYQQYLSGKYKDDFVLAENSAKAKKLGIWKEPSPEPPWEFRKKGLQ